ncbi:MAG: ribbon-helix-helix protein, CopG family [bacterium]
MSTKTSKASKQINALQKMRLPALWERFAEVVGEENRSPNKKYLIRRISEALKAAEAEPAATPKRPARPKAPKAVKATAATKHGKVKKPTKRKGTAEGTPTEEATGDTPLTKLSVADLQARYREVVGRPTGSSHRAYLIWKIGQAQKGRIPVGPTRRSSSTDPADFKVIPLRMETEVVDQIDAARERLEIPSRTALIRRALMVYLARAGENDVAALLAPAE